MGGSWAARACWMLTCLGVLGSTACSGAQSTPRTDGTLELFSWWSSAAEGNALDALLDRFRERYSETDVVLLSSSSTRTAAQDQLDSLMSGAPPDTFQSVGGADVFRWITGGVRDALSPVDDIAAQVNLVASLPRELKNALTYQGSLYAIPLGVSRLNVILYNVQLFSKNKLEPPTTLEQFYTVAEAFRAKGVIPLSLGGRDGSVLSQLLFDALLVRGDNASFRESFLDGKANPEDERIRAAITELGRLLEYTNEDRDDIDWPTAARKVAEGGAAMTFVGDWAKSYLANAGLDPGTRLGQMPFPETQGTFVYLVDSFVLPRQAQHRQAAENFLKLIGSKEDSPTFVIPKGVTAARLDFDSSGYDVLARRNANDFRSNTLMLGHISKVQSREFLKELDSTLRQFSQDSQEQAVRNMLRNRYGQL